MLTLGDPRRLDFATKRELFALFAQNELRATWAALALIHPDALGLTPAAVDARHRTFGNLFAFAGWVWGHGSEAGIDEAAIASVAESLWSSLLGETFPTDPEVKAELGNS
jgi:hypothetical protein